MELHLQLKSQLHCKLQIARASFKFNHYKLILIRGIRDW